MTHLLIGPAGRGRGRGAAGDDGGAGAHHQADGGATPQWTLQQEEVAAGMQAVLSALTSHFPSENVSRGAAPACSAGPQGAPFKAPVAAPGCA